MLIDGAQLLEGSTLELSPIDFGTEFPANAEDGKRFKKEGAGAGSYVYSLFLNKWIKVDNVSFNSYDISASIFDRPRSNDVVVRHVAARTCFLRKDLEGSLASANVAATDLTLFDVFVKSDVDATKVATLRFLAGSSIGVFESVDVQNIIVLGRGYELLIVAPENRDATLSSIAITLAGYLFV